MKITKEDIKQIEKSIKNEKSDEVKSYDYGNRIDFTLQKRETPNYSQKIMLTPMILVKSGLTVETTNFENKKIDRYGTYILDEKIFEYKKDKMVKDPDGQLYSLCYRFLLKNKKIILERRAGFVGEICHTDKTEMKVNLDTYLRENYDKILYIYNRINKGDKTLYRTLLDYIVNSEQFVEKVIDKTEVSYQKEKTL